MISVKVILIISVFATGFIEYVKNFLPKNLKENKIFLTIFSGVISAATGVGSVFIAPVLGFNINPTITNILICGIGTVGTVQVSYEVLLKTFKAVVEKLKTKVSINATVDPDQLAEEIVDKVPETIESVLEKVPLGTDDLKEALNNSSNEE